MDERIPREVEHLERIVGRLNDNRKAKDLAIEVVRRFHRTNRQSLWRFIFNLILVEYRLGKADGRNAVSNQRVREVVEGNFSEEEQKHGPMFPYV